MKINTLLARFAGAVMVLLLSGALNTTAAAAQQAAEQQPAAKPPAVSAQPAGANTTATAPAAAPAQPAGTTLPDSPGAVRLQSAQEGQPAQQEQQTSPPPPPPQPLSQTAKPVGTAAAEMTNTGGATGSEPAGVAIAPAKQRRLRSFLIKMGALAGAGVAVGTVVALSQGSPSKPPGSQ